MEIISEYVLLVEIVNKVHTNMGSETVCFQEMASDSSLSFFCIGGKCYVLILGTQIVRKI